MTRVSRLALVIAVSMAAVLFAPARLVGAEGPPERKHDWDAEVVDTFARLAVQHEGRIKPLSTYAGFTLLKIHGTRSMRLEDAKLDPTEWLLDCLFFPEVAKTQMLFRIHSHDVADAVGVSRAEKERFDYYAYIELFPVRERIFDLAGKYEHIDEKERSAVEGGVLDLARNMREFESLAVALEFAREGFTTGDSQALAEVFDGNRSPAMADILEKFEAVRTLYLDLRDGEGTNDGRDGDRVAIVRLMQDLNLTQAQAYRLAFFPPPGSVEQFEQWLAVSGLVDFAAAGGPHLHEHFAALRDLEAMAKATGDLDALGRHAKSFSNKVGALADKRGEAGKVDLEVSFYKGDYFYRSLLLFVFGFLTLGLTWMWPKARKLYGVAQIMLGGAALLLVTGIVIRCIIRARPPISTLYETILFITAVSVIALLVTEYINRQRIAVAMAALLGAGGMLLARRYEMGQGVDTMPQLVAVLDTNFWLSIHVTTINVGYAAGAMAGVFGHLYVLGRLFGLKRGDKAFYKTVTKMTYGLICFGLLFAVVGTILGGVWANDSWGRFWGWDPKENGALMIVLWLLMTLHARMGGYIHDHGIAMMAIICGGIVAFSWWGVNLLGIGLHTYGFIQGIFWNLVAFYAFEALVVLAGTVHWLVLRGQDAAPPPAPGAEPPLPTS